MPYIGRTLGQGTRSRFLYTATANQTTFSGSDTQSNTLAYADNNGLDCFQNGVLLKGGGADYTATTGTSVVLTTGASASDVIEILVYDVFAIADHVKKSGDAMTGALSIDTGAGTIIDFRKDGTSEGSIAVASDELKIFATKSSTNCGFGFYSNNTIRPVGNDGAEADNEVSLGHSSNRFKDLYLSGGAYIGGTGSANQLDDYEEGNWTPTLTSTSGVTKTAASGNLGRYTKVGNIVNLTGSVLWDGTETLSGLVAVGGLPFTSVNTNGYRSAAAMGAANQVTQPSSYQNGLAMSMDQNSVLIWVVARSTSSYTHYPTIGNTGGIYGINITYRTA